MIYLIFAIDKLDMLSVRENIRQEHRVYLRKKHKLTVIQGGPTIDNESQDMVGTILIVDAESIQHVEVFIENDPYSKVGLFESVVIRPWLPVPIIEGEKI